MGRIFFFAAVFWLLLGAAEVSAQVQRTMINTSFELPSAGTTTCYFQIGESNVPGWLTTETATAGVPCPPNIPTTSGSPLIEIWANNYNGVLARVGNQHAELNAVTAGRLYQNICLFTGEQISWVFSHRGRASDTVPDVAEFRIGSTSGTNRVVDASTTDTGTLGASYKCYANDGNVAGNTCSTALAATWRDYSGTFTWNGASGVNPIGFEAISSAGGDVSVGNFLDNVQITLRPFVEFTSATYTGTEGQTFTPPQLRITGTVPAGGITVLVNITGGTAVLNTDYTTTSGTAVVNVSIPAGVYDGTTSASLFSVPIGLVDNSIIQNNRTVTMAITASPSNYNLASTVTCGGAAITTATLTIIDNDIDLKTTKSVSNATPPAGTTVQYTVTFSNNTAATTVAPTTAHDAVAPVADALPTNLTFSSWTCTASNGASCPGGGSNGTTTGSGAISGNATLPAGNAAAGGVVTYVINALVAAGCPGTILNTATITDPSGLAEGATLQSGFVSPAPGGSANNTASVSISPTCPSLALSKTSNGPWVVGQTSPAPTYTLTVTNAGPAATSGTVTVLDSLPTGITAPASFSSGTWTCTTSGQTVTCTSSTSLSGSGGSSTITIPVTISASAVSSLLPSRRARLFAGIPLTLKLGTERRFL